MKTIVVYPGRFQPFGKHHFQTYKWLTEKFGTENVYISTSNVVDAKSPLSFEEKYAVIRKYGVPKDKIVEADKPYMPSAVLNNLDSSKDSLIVAYGQKDYGRIAFKKKDGTPAYFKNYAGQRDLTPFRENAFVIVAPHVSINHKGYEICGTYLRELLSTCTRKEMFEVMGWVDEGLYGVFRRKFHPIGEERLVKEMRKLETLYEADDFKQMLSANTANQGKYSKHICHPFEVGMTFSEFKRLVYDLSKNHQAVQNCTLKMDGWNFQMTYRNGTFMCSRNKTTVLSPMSLDQLLKKYQDNPKAQKVFGDAFRVLEMALAGNKREDLMRIFDNGSTFVNFEILNEEPLNVLKPGYNALSVHGMVTYDKDGNETHRTSVLPQIIDTVLGRTFNGVTIIETPKIVLKDWKVGTLFIDRLNLLQHKYKIPESTNIMYLPKPVLNELRVFTFELGNAFIKANYSKVDSANNVNRVISIIDLVDEHISGSDVDSFSDSCYLLDRLGGLSSINPIEGFVFEWGGYFLKLTGSFGALVPIFRIWNKLRFS
jgi:hypothetical protein